MDLPLGLPALLLAVALVAVPAAAAENVRFETVTVYMEPERFDAELVGQAIEGGNASLLRKYVDRNYGDDDGIVVAAEVEAYEEDEKRQFNENLSNPFAKFLTANIKVNERAPLEQIVTDIEISKSALGSVDSTTVVIRNINASITFTSTERDRANVTFKQDFRQVFTTQDGRMEWETAYFFGREPWVIDAETIDPDGKDNRFWTDDGFEVAYAEMSEFSNFNEPLTFQVYDLRAEDAKDKKKGSPGVEAVALALAVVGLAAFLRRRA